MKRHTNQALTFTRLNNILEAVQIELFKNQKKHGGFNSAHEMSAVLREEFEEFWDSVKQDDPDPAELIQVAAVAIAGIQCLAITANEELEEIKKNGKAS